MDAPVSLKHIPLAVDPLPQANVHHAESYGIYNRQGASKSMSQDDEVKISLPKASVMLAAPPPQSSGT